MSSQAGKRQSLGVSAASARVGATMAPKRKQDDAGLDNPVDGGKQHKKKKGFSVGPANLPDGTYRRKGSVLINLPSLFRLFDRKG